LLWARLYAEQTFDILQATMLNCHPGKRDKQG
jgi:hypothetical protein